MKQLLTQLAAMQPSSGADKVISEGNTFLADIEEGKLLTGLRDYIVGLDNSELRRLWQNECRKALPPGRGHEHVHRKTLVENLLQSLSNEQGSSLTTPKRILNMVQLEVIATLEKIKRNDALYPLPVPK